MLKRNETGVVTAASGDHFDVKQYVWHKYTNARGVKLTDARGRSVTIRKGDLFGVKEATTKYDRVLVQKAPTLVFKVDIPTSEKIMERSDEYKKKVKLEAPEVKPAKPAKVKVDLKQPEDAADVKAKRVKPAKNAITFEETDSGIDCMVDGVSVLFAQATVGTRDRIGAIGKRSREYKTWKIYSRLLKKDLAVPYKLSKVGARKMMAKVAKKYIEQGLTNSQAHATPKPEKPNVAAKRQQKIVESKLPKTPKATKIKIDMQAPEDDDDEIPLGHVRHGGRLITPDELEIDDDLHGLDFLPIPKHYSSLSAITMYHGSQTESVDWNNFKLLFITANPKVADDYAHGRVAFTGVKRGPITPTVYQLQISPRKIFDLRKPQCKEDYEVVRTSNPDQELPSLRSEGFIMSRTGLPGYGHVRGMRDGLVDLGYDCMYVDEGSQGVSLAVFQPHVITGKVKLENAA